MTTKTQESWKSRFDSRFGQFYLKAFNSGKFFHLNGAKDNQATIDFVAGKNNKPTASEDVKDFISQEIASAIARTREEVVEKIEEIETMAGGDPENHIDYISKEEVLQAIKQEK